MMKKNRNSKGFSLVEFFIAIALISILFAMGIPGFDLYFKRITLNNTLRAITAGLNTARYKAIMLNKKVKFCIEEEDTEKRIILKEKRKNRWQELLHFDLEKEIYVYINAAPVFSPNGAVAPLCSVYVENDLSSYKITISSAGRIKVMELRE
jgi:prepilin-type N-terminal cleavage/methylation domain-containing protein